MKISIYATNWLLLLLSALLAENAYTADIGTVQKYPWGWAHKTDGEIFSLPSIREDIYFGNCQGHLFCLSKHDGNVKWKISGLNSIFSDPLFFEDKIYVAAITDKLYCFSASSGKKIWDKQIPGCGHNNPQAYGNNILILGIDEVVAVSKNSGKTSFSLKIKAKGNSLAIKNDLCYVISNWDSEYKNYTGMGALTCIDLNNKKILWSKSLEGACLGEVSIDNEQCYLGCRNGFFYALNNNNGAVLWKIDCSKMVSMAPQEPIIEAILKDKELDDRAKNKMFRMFKNVWADGCVIADEQHIFFEASHQVISFPGSLICAKKDDGRIIWKVNHKTQFCGQFAIRDGKIIAVTEDRVIYIIDKKTGKSKTFSILPDAGRGEFVGVAKGDDAVYIAGGDKTIYKVIYREIEKKKTPNN